MTKQSILIAYLTVVLLATTLFACHHDTQPGTDEITGTRIEISPDYTGTYFISVYDNILLSSSYDPGYLCEAGEFVGDSLKPKGMLIKRGVGPDEATSIALCIPSRDSLLVISEGGDSKFSFSTMKVDSARFVDRYPTQSKTNYMWVFDTFVMENDTTLLGFITRADSADNIIGRYDYKNSRLSKVDYWPDGAKDAPSMPTFMMYASNSQLLSNGKGRYLYSVGLHPYAFIFSLDDEKLTDKVTLYEKEIKYGADADGLNFTMPELPKEMLKVTSDSSCIYILENRYNANGEAPKAAELGNYGNIVKVFDWDGNLLRTLKLDHLGGNILKDPKSDYFYLFTKDPDTGDPAIWRYDAKVAE